MLIPTESEGHFLYLLKNTNNLGEFGLLLLLESSAHIREMNRKEMAKYIGVSVGTISSYLNNLESFGFIRCIATNGEKITVINVNSQDISCRLELMKGFIDSIDEKVVMTPSFHLEKKVTQSKDLWKGFFKECHDTVSPRKFPVSEAVTFTKQYEHVADAIWWLQKRTGVVKSLDRKRSLSDLDFLAQGDFLLIICGTGAMQKPSEVVLIGVE